MWLYITEGGFDAIFDWYLSMLGRLFYLHIVKSTPCTNHAKNGFLDLHTDVNVTFYVFYVGFFHIVALLYH